MIGFMTHMAKPCNLALGDRRVISSNALHRGGRAPSLKIVSSKGAEHEVLIQKRRAVIFGIPALAFAPKPALAGLFNGKTPLQEAFELAIGLGQQDPTSAAADEAWGKAIKLAPDNAAAYSNRGTLRLQASPSTLRAPLRARADCGQATALSEHI
ncbi:hypothetical protein CYMTET_50395 [Cymbomonas tetramitiformis]|uniref:Uncharacterized protein n=1 Tax=Cymbomonas tetramitiformis TaxID=36881 RepID=A0AAE0ETR0_9CHLO|nr:hypothetical protein CYMTET_50395 [Cymbomonas tetramitiformis]